MIFLTHSPARPPSASSLFVSPLRNRSAQIYTPAARWSDAGNFHCLSTLPNHHHLVSPLGSPSVGDDHPEATRLTTVALGECLPIVLSDCYRVAANPIKIPNWFVVARAVSPETRLLPRVSSRGGFLREKAADVFTVTIRAVHAPISMHLPGDQLYHATFISVFVDSSARTSHSGE